MAVRFWLYLLVLCGVIVSLLAPPAYAAPATVAIEFTLGTSVQGRDITAWRFGSGERKLVVVGDTHGAPEANTYHLAEELVAHFRANPHEVPVTVRLYIIPTLNPDGLALQSRFNATGVDLNRNMNTNLDACAENDWSGTVYGAYGIVSSTGGAHPESEVESRLIRNFLLDASGAIFLHCNAGEVFPAFCEHAPSIAMAQTYATAAGYQYSRFWQGYTINGGMHDWAASIGIAAIIPELVTATESEFSQNVAGIHAVMHHATELLPLPTDQPIGDIMVPALIWRYWQTHGGESLFGVPLEPAHHTTESVSQTFTNVRIEIRWSQADTIFLVQPAPIGSVLLPDGVPTPGAHYDLFGAFLQFWYRHGGVAVFGYPLSNETTRLAADGTERIVQHFERAAFAYYPEDNQVRLEPLGWQLLLHEQLQAPWAKPHVR